MTFYVIKWLLLTLLFFTITKFEAKILGQSPIITSTFLNEKQDDSLSLLLIHIYYSTFMNAPNN